ncbi:hypothetical protein KR222_000975 [Zaprionus bogoriensis]|nr:hypothetical protein KR222_000975 [Zaprionus bogoriensis]
MPFGLCNATSTMSRLMDKVVPPHYRNEVFVYLDDLLVVSSSFETHLKVLRELAVHIERAGLTINISKSHFCMKRVRYLGHIIGDGGIRTDPEKLNLLDDRSILFNRPESFELIHTEAKKRAQKMHDENEKRYNLRSKEVSFKVGQEVFRRNFKPSCFQSGYNAKFGPSFVKARVRNKLGNCYYELEDPQGRTLGTYHAKDIRQ